MHVIQLHAIDDDQLGYSEMYKIHDIIVTDDVPKTVRQLVHDIFKTKEAFDLWVWTYQTPKPSIGLHLVHELYNAFTWGCFPSDSYLVNTNLDYRISAMYQVGACTLGTWMNTVSDDVLSLYELYVRYCGVPTMIVDVSKYTELKNEERQQMWDMFRNRYEYKTLVWLQSDFAKKDGDGAITGRMAEFLGERW